MKTRYELVDIIPESSAELHNEDIFKPTQRVRQEGGRGQTANPMYIEDASQGHNPRKVEDQTRTVWIGRRAACHSRGGERGRGMRSCLLGGGERREGGGHHK